MSWENEEVKAPVATKEPEVVQPEKAEAKEPEVVQPKQDEVKSESNEAKEVPSQPEPEAKADEGSKEDLVPQKLVGKIAKSIREKSKSEIAQQQQRIQMLEQQVANLSGGSEVDTNSDDETIPTREDIRQEFRNEFLKQQDAYGKATYGEDYTDALLLITSKNDPVLVKKIQESATPAETAMKEAQRIAEEQQYGNDPQERQKNMQAEIEARIRKEVEAEFAQKIAAKNNQPTDVQNVRAAGGDARPGYTPQSWDNTLPK